MDNYKRSEGEHSRAWLKRRIAQLEAQLKEERERHPRMTSPQPERTPGYGIDRYEERRALGVDFVGPDRGDRAFDAYYYGFSATDCEPVDAILKAIAAAGKAYHNTNEWREFGWGESEDTEANCIEKMQHAANLAAIAFSSAPEPSADRALAKESQWTPS